MVDLSESGEHAAVPASERPNQSSFSAEVHCFDADAPIVVARGEVDIATAAELSQAMTEAVERSPTRVILDLADVTFMDSSGIKVIVHAQKNLPAGCQVVLRQPQPAVRMVFEVTGLIDLFVIED